jgi:hypothetical protein
MSIKEIHNIFILVALISLASCSPVKSQSRKDKKENKKYEEDLSSYRVKYNSKNDSMQSSGVNKIKKDENVVPQKDITKNLNAKLDTISKNNDIKYAQGFRILVYSGKKSEEVKNTRTQVYDIIPDADIYTDYKSPNQRVKVGNCFDRLEAYNLYSKLRKTFPHAVIIPDQVIIKGK